MEKNKPGFFALLPACVRYDPRLIAEEKILYAEITALSNRDGYCTASNTYFVWVFGKSRGTVKRWLAKLILCGYIRREQDGLKRRIYPIVTGGLSEMKKRNEPPEIPNSP